jgi:hypothetical protein
VPTVPSSNWVPESAGYSALLVKVKVKVNRSTSIAQSCDAHGDAHADAHQIVTS